MDFKSFFKFSKTNLLHHTSNSDKKAFINALENDDLEACADISSSARVSGEIINHLVEESGYDNRINFLPYMDDYSLRTSCEMILVENKALKNYLDNRTNGE